MGTITATAGSTALRAIVHNGLSMLTVHARPSDGEAKCRWVFRPAAAGAPQGPCTPRSPRPTPTRPPVRIDDPLAPKWRAMLAELTPYPFDGNGFMIGAGQPFAMSHRHYSHMLSVHPLYLVNWVQPENRDLIRTSVDHWISFKGAVQGYSHTGAASFAAQMPRGNDSAPVPQRPAAALRAAQHHVQGDRPGDRDAPGGVPVDARHDPPELARG